MQRASKWVYVTGLALVAATAACGGKEGGAVAGGAASGDNANSPAARPESTSAAAVARPRASDAPRILFMGTSLTAGLGLDDPEIESWVGAIQHFADSLGIPLHATHAGASGETSAGALRRSEWLFRQSFDMLVLETGANDGLRGLNPDSTAENIRSIIRRARAARPDVPVLLVQMEAPTNMGPYYTKAFHDVFPRVASEMSATLLPFLLEGVGGIPKYNQGDGIHPTAEGARMAALNVWPTIRQSLRAR